MKEAKALAFVNAYGVLRTLENLCDMVDEAKAVCTELKKPVALCFDVTDGPCVTYSFSKDGCKFTEGDYGCTCKMKFSSTEKFNALIDNSECKITYLFMFWGYSFRLNRLMALC